MFDLVVDAFLNDLLAGIVFGIAFLALTFGAGFWAGRK